MKNALMIAVLVTLVSGLNNFAQAQAPPAAAPAPPTKHFVCVMEGKGADARYGCALVEEVTAAAEPANELAAELGIELDDPAAAPAAPKLKVTLFFPHDSGDGRVEKIELDVDEQNDGYYLNPKATGDVNRLRWTFTVNDKGVGTGGRTESKYSWKPDSGVEPPCELPLVFKASDKPFGSDNQRFIVKDDGTIVFFVMKAPGRLSTYAFTYTDGAKAPTLKK